jgi:hypothetical protein
MCIVLLQVRLIERPQINMYIRRVGAQPPKVPTARCVGRSPEYVEITRSLLNARKN